MPTPIERYKTLVDGLVGIHEGVLAKWTRDNKWPAVEKNNNITELLSSLTPEQREVIAGVIEQAREGGIHDTLVYFNDQMCINGLRFTQDGEEVPVQPFDTQLYYDWICRLNKDEWPDEAEE